MSTPWVRSLLESLASWAESRPDIVGVALVGSHARGEARPDSDIDVVVITSAPRRYLTDTAWAHGFGLVERLGLEEYGAVTSVRVRYRSGDEVEFSVASPEWARLPLDEGTRRVVHGGFRVVFDRGGLLTAVADTTASG